MDNEKQYSAKPSAHIGEDGRVCQVTADGIFLEHPNGGRAALKLDAGGVPIFELKSGGRTATIEPDRLTLEDADDLLVIFSNGLVSQTNLEPGRRRVSSLRLDACRFDGNAAS